MRSRATPRFWAAYRELPPETREAARRAYCLGRENARHPSLQFKEVHDRDPIYSVRVTLGYRALGFLVDDEITCSGSARILSMTASSNTCSYVPVGPTPAVTGRGEQRKPRSAASGSSTASFCEHLLKSLKHGRDRLRRDLTEPADKALSVDGP